MGYVGPYKALVGLATSCGILKFTLPLLFPLALGHLVDEVVLNPGLSPEAKGREVLQLELHVGDDTIVQPAVEQCSRALRQRRRRGTR